MREEALERLAQTDKRKLPMRVGEEDPPVPERRGSKRSRDLAEDQMDLSGSEQETQVFQPRNISAGQRLNGVTSPRRKYLYDPLLAPARSA